MLLRRVAQRVDRARLVRRASTARAQGLVDEPLGTVELERKLVELHAPGQHRNNAKWSLYGGHQRARNFANFHGVFPALLPPFTPCVELVARIGGGPDASSAPAARTHLLYGNTLPSAHAYASAPAVSFCGPSPLSAKLDGAAQVDSGAPWTLVGLTFSPAFSPAMVDGRFLARYPLPLEGGPPPAVVSHAHLVIANVPAADRLAEGEALLESDVAGFDAHALRTDDGLVHALSHLRAFGVLRIDGMPATRDATRALVLRIGAPRSTYYSAEMWSTRAAPGERKGINDTAYTSVGIRPHTDGTYFRDPPGLQILNCVSQAERGGESLVVDALSVVESLRAAAPATLDFLARTPLPWFSYDEDVRSGLPIRLSTHEPVLRFDASGDLDQFRYNEYDRGDLAPGEWYDSTFLPHWRALVEQVNAPAHVEHVRLEPGQCLVVDNQRVLHGRTPFDGGVREMVGCYVGRDEYESRLRSVGLLRMCG